MTTLAEARCQVCGSKVRAVGPSDDVNAMGHDGPVRRDWTVACTADRDHPLQQVTEFPKG